MAIYELPKADAFVLRNCSVPTIFLAPAVSDQENDVVMRDVHVAAGKIVAVTPVNAGSGIAAECARIDVERAMIWPCLADLHCHLDKGQIVDRAPPCDGTFTSALDAVAADKVHWTGVDTRLRMEFGLRCAFA